MSLSPSVAFEINWSVRLCFHCAFSTVDPVLITVDWTYTAPSMSERLGSGVAACVGTQPDKWVLRNRLGMTPDPCVLEYP